jgi:Spy/CpxP family protein refolding chaperone
MARNQLGVSAVWAVVVSLAVALAWAAAPALAEDASATKKEKKERKESFARLPAHFGKVVDESQREKIYDIQKEYGPKIKALREQLDALLNQCDEKIDAVLTPEQRKQIEQLAADAKARRKAASEERKQEKPKAKTAEKADPPAK